MYIVTILIFGSSYGGMSRLNEILAGRHLSSRSVYSLEQHTSWGLELINVADRNREKSKVKAKGAQK